MSFLRLVLLSLVLGSALANTLVNIDLSFGSSSRLNVENTGGLVKVTVPAMGPFTLEIRSFGGFECLVVNSVKRDNGVTVLEVQWSPGADQSGCFLEVTRGEDKALLELYMDY